MEVSFGNIDQIDKLLTALKEAPTKASQQKVKAVTDYGAGYAATTLIGMIGSNHGVSEVVKGIESEYDPVTNVGIIRASHYASSYLEYGTGTVGAYNPHPTRGAPFGYRIGYWPFFWISKNQWSTTMGQASKPFMYQTYMHLQDMVTK